MKKTILGLLSLVVLFATINVASAKVTAPNSQTAEAIRLYKSGNYTQSYFAFSKITSKDSSNALAAYYLGMSAAQLGRKEEAISNYEKAASLSPNSILSRYAKQGIRCAEDSSKCREHSFVTSDPDETAEDKFIRSIYGFTEKARGTHEKERLENIKREMNRDSDLPPQKFREYKDFSSQAPTNEEIVSAMRVLQRAGMSNFVGNSSYAYDIDNLAGIQQNSNNADYDMLKFLFGRNSNSSNLNPQVIQSLLTTQMTTSF